MFLQDVFHERVKVFQNWQHSILMLNKKREQKAKMDLANKADKGPISTEIVEVMKIPGFVQLYSICNRSYFLDYKNLLCLMLMISFTCSGRQK